MTFTPFLLSSLHCLFTPGKVLKIEIIPSGNTYIKYAVLTSSTRRSITVTPNRVTYAYVIVSVYYGFSGVPCGLCIPWTDIHRKGLWRLSSPPVMGSST